MIFDKMLCLIVLLCHNN